MQLQYLKSLLFFMVVANAASLFSQKNETVLVHGKVYDSYTREVVSAATVSVSGGSAGVITDERGEFSLMLPVNERVTVNLTHIGYYPYSFTHIPQKNAPMDLVIYFIPKDLNLETVLITGNHFHSKFEEISNLAGVVEGVDLQKNLGLTLAATLKNETGLAIRSMGPAPARPVIRGLGGDRILFTEDGAKTADLSSTSPDHALTIEPFSITRADIIRGPRVLLFSPVTLGGVVNVVRHDIPVENFSGISAGAGSYYESANNGFLYGGRTELGTGPLVVQAGFTSRSSTNLRTPGGTLKNSFSSVTGLSVGGSWVTEPGFMGYSYRSIDMEYGIPGGFVGSHPNGVRISVFRNVYSAKGSLNFDSGLLHNLTLHYSRSFYRHKEYERNDLIGAEFRIVDHYAYLNLEHHIFGFNEDGVIGLSGQLRDFEVGGFVFTPYSTSKNLALYFWQPFNYNGLSFEFSGRVNGDVITPRTTKKADIGLIRERDFISWSFSASMIYGLSESLFAGTNLSRSSRVPTIEELFSEGPHLAAYSYETGNPDLESESGLGYELFIYWRSKGLYALLNAYYYSLDGFILPRNTGRTNYQTFLPIYATSGEDANLTGFEFETEVEPFSGFTLSSRISYTSGSFAAGGALPQIPPLKLVFGANYRFGSGTTIELSTETAMAQERTDSFESPTAGYTILNSGIYQPFTLGRFTGLLSAGVDNLFDIEYRNHLSRVKSIMPEAGRNFRTTLRIYFQ